MPKQSDYSKGLIYKLCCRDTNIKDIYIGSTCNFVKRKYNHKGACNNENHNGYNHPIYKFIREKGGWDNWNMVLVKYFSCNSRLELLKEEQNVIEEFGEYTTLNRQRTWRSVEYVKEYLKNNSKKHYINNKEKYKKKNTKYNEDNKEKIKEYKRKWVEDNKEKVEEYKRKNEEQGKQPYTCLTCNRTMRKSNKLRHEKTKTHLQNLQ